MKLQVKKNLIRTVILLIAFGFWTVVALCCGVQPSGPEHSPVGLAAINGPFHEWTGVNMTLYQLTDWLGLVPLLFVFFFGMIGLVQWIRRKNILKVDWDILVLGAFFLIVLGLFFFFNHYAINYRPVLIEGVLEPSYPSSTTLMVLCVMPTAFMQFDYRLKSIPARRIMQVFLILFAAFMVIARILSGVHWISDIIGGILLSAALISAYVLGISALPEKKDAGPV